MNVTLPPGSKLPHLIQELHWIANPISYMETCAKQYGDIFSAFINGRDEPLILVSNPEALQQLLTDDAFYAPGFANQILAPLTGYKAITMLDGDRHKRERKLLMPSFHGDRMRDYGQLIVDITQQITSKLAINQPFSARNIMQEISLAVILKAVFGVYEGERYDQLKVFVTAMLEVGRTPLTSAHLFFPILQQDLGQWSPWGHFLKQRQQLDELILAEIEERRQNPDQSRTDILSLMMAARDEEGNPMTDQELRDELLILLFAGHETTATAMAWSLYWVYKQPEVYEKLMQELNHLPPDADPMTIFRLPYLTAVCQETLRIYPVGMLTFVRMTKKPTELMGYQLPEKTALVGCIYLTHHREDLYPQPDQFKPERFLERKFSPYEYLPFGGGVRVCLGMALAQYEMKLVLATLLRNYEFKLVEKRPVKPGRRGVTLSPVGGVKMIITGKRMQSEKLGVAVGAV